jgi:hypothetical protein
MSPKLFFQVTGKKMPKKPPLVSKVTKVETSQEKKSVVAVKKKVLQITDIPEDWYEYFDGLIKDTPNITSELKKSMDKSLTNWRKLQKGYDKLKSFKGVNYTEVEIRLKDVKRRISSLEQYIIFCIEDNKKCIKDRDVHKKR